MLCMYLYFSTECKVKTKNNQKVLVVIRAGTPQATCTPQNLRPRAGDCMHPN